MSVDPAFLDEADTRNELSRQFNICSGCRRCTDLCAVFPTLFDAIERHADRDAGRLTPAQQDGLVDACIHCQLCRVGCPHVVEQVDIPRLMVRAQAMRRATGEGGVRRNATTRVLGRTELIGRVASSASLVGGIIAAKPRSVARRVTGALTGVSAVRLVAPFARVRFSTWFKRRPKVRIARPQAAVAVFPTCLVEYQNPAIGQDLVKVYERNGIDTTMVEDTTCCGAPWLHSGDLEHFAAAARKNIAALTAAGRDVVVPQPTCAMVIRQEYDDQVASRVFDATDYLMRVHKGDGTALDLDFDGDVPAAITYHVACHLRAEGVGLPGRDLLRLTGARVHLVEQCAGMGSLWGMRASNDRLSSALATSLGESVERVGTDVVVGDCQLANTVVSEQTGAAVSHPLQILARAYGIPAEA
jgi:Fe-S oxidoreductase